MFLSASVCLCLLKLVCLLLYLLLCLVGLISSLWLGFVCSDIIHTKHAYIQYYINTYIHIVLYIRTYIEVEVVRRGHFKYLD